MATLRHTPPTIVCPSKCCCVLRLDAYFPAPFFNNAVTTCPYCGKSFDLWEHAVNLLREKAQLFRNMGASFIGGRQISFTFQLPPNETTEVDLVHYGVPEDAKLIYVVYTPNAGAGWPIEMHSNQPLQHRTSHKMVFFGKPFPDSVVTTSGKHDVDMLVTYIPKSDDQIPFENLANAYEYFLSDNYEEIIIPSSVAVEHALKRLISELLSIVGRPNNLNTSKRTEFEVILPLICQLRGVPNLDNRISQPVIKLWKLRDQMAHEGASAIKIDLNEAAQLLAAAMFCVNYFSFVKSKVCQNLISTQPQS